MRITFLNIFSVFLLVSFSAYGMNNKLFESEAEFQFHRVFSKASHLEEGLRLSLAKPFLEKSDVVTEDDVSDQFRRLLERAKELESFPERGSFDNFVGYCSRFYAEFEGQPRKQFVVCELLERVTARMILAAREIKKLKQEKIAASREVESGETSFPDVFKDFFPGVKAH